MVGCCREGHLAWSLKGKEHPQGEMQLEEKQEETHHRPCLELESTDVKFTGHWIQVAHCQADCPETRQQETSPLLETRKP